MYKSFFEFATKKFLDENTPAGDLAKDMQGDDDFPADELDPSVEKEKILSHLQNKGACAECIDTFEDCWKKYINEINVGEKYYLDASYPIFKRVIELGEAVETKDRENAHPGGRTLRQILEEGFTEEDEKKALREYLEALDYETIEIIEAIMLVGRDSDWSAKNAFGEEKAWLQKDYGISKNKGMAVSYILGKPLATYMKMGLRKMGVFM